MLHVEQDIRICRAFPRFIDLGFLLPSLRMVPSMLFPLPHQLNRLIISTTACWKLEHYRFTRQFPVYLPIRIKSEVHATPLLLVQNHLANLASILTCPNPLSNNFDGIDYVMKERVVYSGQSSAVRTLLGLRCTRAV